jgi:hypothetical protein
VLNYSPVAILFGKTDSVAFLIKKLQHLTLLLGIRSVKGSTGSNSKTVNPRRRKQAGSV